MSSLGLQTAFSLSFTLREGKKKKKTSLKVFSSQFYKAHENTIEQGSQAG